MSTGLLQNMNFTYYYVLDEISDPRVSEWWLMDSPWKPMAILSSYLYFCRVLGPRFMSNRKPFQLQPVIAVYNAFQIIGSFLVFSSFLFISWRKNMSLGCEEMDYSNDPDAVWLLSIFWYGMLLRIADFIETAFFVLRKKFAQVSFLHLYHHTTSLVFIWLTTKYAGGGVSFVPVMVNSLVHAAMYTYYLLSAVGAKSVVRWKRRLTQLQMGQFVFLLVHTLNLLLSDCAFPKTLPALHAVNLVMNFYLFYGFYQRAYTPPIKCTVE